MIQITPDKVTGQIQSLFHTDEMQARRCFAILDDRSGSKRADPARTDRSGGLHVVPGQVSGWDLRRLPAIGPLPTVGDYEVVPATG